MQAFENHIHWNAVKEVSSRLKSAGFQALLAGGCVRDLLMGREPNDFDLATSATPDEVSRLFPHALEVGKAFGVSIIPFEGFQIEVATFREDLSYHDGRRPEGVRFSTAEADARRRDFTVNALFYDFESQQVIDYVDGRADLAARVIRTVGEPERRFGEDKLRLLRAVRFAAQLDFTIEPATFASVQHLAPEIGVVSRERVRDELLKLLKTSHRVRGLELLQTSGLLAAAFPSVFKAVARHGQRWLTSFEDFPAEASDLPALLALFHQPLFEEFKAEGSVDSALMRLRKSELPLLRLDHLMTEAVLFCYRHEHEFLEPETVRRGVMALLTIHPSAPSALRFVEAVERAQGLSSEQLEERRGFLHELKAAAFGESGLKPEPLVKGADAKVAGLAPGPVMGQLLHEAYLLQLEGRFLDRSEALAWLQEEVRAFQTRA